MASWMIHLRVADQLLDKLPGLSAQEFIMGNIAPDSGVPNEDWSKFSPPTKVSHFKTSETGKDIVISEYVAQYFTKELQEKYSQAQYSFYLGYLTHLMTDIFWSKSIVHPALALHAAECAEDRNALIWKMKKDWYDLDFLYLQEHPDFRAFDIYQNAAGFQNTFMDIFSPDAFDNRREYITGFYSEKRENLSRHYPYLSIELAARFVEESVAEIMILLQSYLH